MQHRKTYFLVTVALAIALFTVACAKKEEVSEKAPAPAATKRVDAATAGTVTGKVLFSGTAPKPALIRMDKEPWCAQMHKGPVYSEEVLPGEKGSLQNVFVYVKQGLDDYAFDAPKTPAKLDQHGCVYIPHVMGVMVGQEVDIVNSDQATHNIHPTPKHNQEWNQSQPTGGDVIKKQFPRPETMLPIKCNQHPWMKMYVNVVKNPIFAVTGKDGTFELKGLPPGTYTIEAVHEKYGAVEQQVTVAPKETKTLDFTVTAAATPGD